MEREIKVTPLYFDYIFGAQYDAVVEIGGRYSAKSYNSQIEEACNLASKKDYKLLIIQELDKGSSDGYYAGIVDKIEQFGHTPAYNITTSSTKITNNINGNKVLFRGYKTEQQKKDVKNIDQVTKIVVEEGEWMTLDDFLSLIQQLRGKVKEDRRLDILLNPVNEYCFANTELVEKPPDKILLRFPNSNRPKVFERHLNIDTVDIDGKPTKLKINILVVLSTHYDNPYLTDIQRAAIEIYRTTDPEKYLQLGEARFIKSGGAYFKEFTRDIHVIEPFVIPEDWTRYRSLDYGLDKLAVLWFAVAPDNSVYCYKELHEEGLIVSKACERIKQVNGSDVVRATYNPSDLQSRTKDTGIPVTELFKQHGVLLTQSSNKRIQGWLTVKEAIKVFTTISVDTGTEIKDTKLKIFDNCETLIKYMQQIKTSETDANDVADTPHELTHICDALRYFAVTRFNTYQTKETKPKYDPYNDYVNEITSW